MTRWVPRVAGAILLAASSACSASGGADGGGNASPCADVVCVDSLPTLQSGTTAGASRSPDTDWHAASPFLHGAAPTPALEAQLAVVCDSSQDGTPQPGGTYACD